MLYLIIFVLAATFQPEINDFFSQDFGFSSPHAVFEVYAICEPVLIVLLLILAAYDIVRGLLWTAGGSFHFVRDKKPSTATIVFAFAWVIIYATAIAAAVVGTVPATVASIAVAYIVPTTALHIAYPKRTRVLASMDVINDATTVASQTITTVAVRPIFVKRTRVLVSRGMAKVSASVSASVLVSAADLIKSPMTARIAVWMVASSAQCICIPFAIVPIYLKTPAITELIDEQEEPETTTETATKELLPKPIAWIATLSVKHQGCAVATRKPLPAPAAQAEQTGAVVETKGKNAIAAAKLLARKNDAAAKARARAIIAVVQVLAKGTIAAAEAQAREAIAPATTQTNKTKSPAEILGNETNAPIQAAKAPPAARRKRTRSRRTKEIRTSKKLLPLPVEAQVGETSAPAKATDDKATGTLRDSLVEETGTSPKALVEEFNTSSIALVEESSTSPKVTVEETNAAAAARAMLYIPFVWPEPESEKAQASFTKRRKRTRSRRTRKSGTSTKQPMLLVVSEGLKSNIELMFGTIAVKG
ncbi:hypothetical protein FB645_001308 [Coemansia sp. IMI 203386]|nr:hypothetical protein FB645_001308 [Coemansia sp. IMI 203386]